MTESFLLYKRGLWLKVNVVSLLVLIVLYCLDAPIGGKNGWTWLGYSYGVLAAAGILYLLWYGIRKRSYHSSQTTLKGCLSAHAWLGITLALLVPLHSGFEFGFDVHTLAYVLMMVVILSGIYGAVEYSRSASLIAAHRGGGHAPALLDSISRVSREIVELTTGKSTALSQVVSRADFRFEPSVWSCLRGTAVPQLHQQAVAEQLTKLSGAEHDDALKIIGLITRKRELAEKLQSDIRVLARLKLWLWVHLPVSIALFIAVIAHVVIVSWYR